MTRNRLSRTKVKAIDQAAEKVAVIRAAAKDPASKQPRFNVAPQNWTQLFYQVYGWGKAAIFNEPPYQADSRKRDKWLLEVVPKEPYLLGIQQSIVTIDKNRGFTMTGGKIQVKRFLGVAHGVQVAPDIRGWRPGISVGSQSFWGTDLGAVYENGRVDIDGAEGPLAQLYTVDPTKCRLTGSSETPLQYTPAGQDGYWTNSNYFRVTSFPKPNEEMNGLGFCAASRCVELAKLMVSIYEHYRERLGSKAPKGILTINGGLTLPQWLQSLEESTAELKTLEREYYSGVQVLVGDAGRDISVALTPLSNLPDQFDLKTTIDIIIWGYALAHGYDPREFWPVGGGTLGTGRETETQHRKATTKGGLDFALGFQEEFQKELPPTIQFEFEQRDVEGDIAEIALNKAKFEIVNEMYKSANANAEILITHEQAMQLLVEAKLVPEDWTAPEEDLELSDTDDVESLVEKQRVQAAMAKYPNDDIVQYSSSTDKFRVIRKAGETKPFKMRVAKKVKLTSFFIRAVVDLRRDAIKNRAAGDFDTIRQDYWEAVYDAVSGYLESSRPSTSFKSAMSQAVVNAFTAAVDAGYQDGGGELPLDDEVNAWLTAEQGAELANVGALFASLAMLRKEEDTDAIQEGFDRAEGYSRTIDGLYNKAVVFGAGNQMLTFDGDDGKESCIDCQKLKGQSHRASWWVAHDYVPPTGEGLACAPGGLCQHGLFDKNNDRVTVSIDRSTGVIKIRKVES